jgi:hypothetical protein
MALANASFTAVARAITSCGSEMAADLVLFVTSAALQPSIPRRCAGGVNRRGMDSAERGLAPIDVRRPEQLVRMCCPPNAAQISVTKPMEHEAGAYEHAAEIDIRLLYERAARCAPEQ